MPSSKYLSRVWKSVFLFGGKKKETKNLPKTWPQREDHYYLSVQPAFTFIFMFLKQKKIINAIFCMYYILLTRAGSSWIESEKLFRNTKKLFKYVLQECNAVAALLVFPLWWISKHSFRKAFYSHRQNT